LGDEAVSSFVREIAHLHCTERTPSRRPSGARCKCHPEGYRGRREILENLNPKYMFLAYKVIERVYLLTRKAQFLIKLIEVNLMRKMLFTLLLIVMACSLAAPIQIALPQAAAHSFKVITHPDGSLYVGDKVSFEVLDPVEGDNNRSVRISLGDKALGEKDIHPFGMGGRSEATFYWIWDTQGLKPGIYTLTFTLLPAGTHWDENFTLLPAADVPYPEPNARWESVDTNCCVIHYISGTDAEKDLDSLKAMVDAQAADVESRFGVKLKGKIPVTFMPRTLGHGGFTSDGIYVSYLHQNYAGGSATQVMHHEMVHWLDGQQPGDLRPSILQEGLAVYLSGGHFKKEPILPRAAALFDLDWYIPLDQLTKSFYTSQHEIGYVEAAAFIDYLVTTYSWDQFNAFYRDIHNVPGGSQVDALDAALKVHFKTSLADTEKGFIAFLHKQVLDDANRTDLRLTVSFYDTVRRYQQLLDPSAYFLYAWLPDVPEMRQRGIVADLLRKPDSVVNRKIESMLVTADADLRAGNYTGVENNVRTVNLILDFFQYWKWI